MKKLLGFPLLLLLFGACVQEMPSDVEYVIHGKVIDAVQKSPVRNVVLYVERAHTDCTFCEYQYSVLGTATSASDGSFEIPYWLSSEQQLSNVLLKIIVVPPGYQNAARINGEINGCIAAHETEEALGYNGLVDKQFYTVELMPATFVRIFPPTLPPSWNKDTLELQTNNLRLSPGGAAWVETCSGLQDKIKFSLNDRAAWMALQQPLPLWVGDCVYLTYTIRNETVKKTGHFSVNCCLGDTTDIVLPITL